MKTQLITRRRALIAGAAGVGGLLVPRYWKDLPPTYGNILRMGDTLTYAAHRTLLPGQSLVREYSRSDITSFPATGTTSPGDGKQPLSEQYRQLQSGTFAGWRLSVEGLVGSPGSFTLARSQANASADADHAAYVRGGMDRHRRVDRRTTQPGARRRRRPPADRALRRVSIRSTTGSTASTCSTPCIRRRSWPTA